MNKLIFIYISSSVSEPPKIRSSQIKMDRSPDEQDVVNRVGTRDSASVQILGSLKLSSTCLAFLYEYEQG